MNPLAPKVPPGFGPARSAALLQSQAGWCAIPGCELPIPSSTDKRGRAKGGRYTCQRAGCVYAWVLLCQRDVQHRKRRKCAPSGMIHRRGAA